MFPFWVLDIIRHLYLGDPTGDHNFDNHPHAADFRTLVPQTMLGILTITEMLIGNRHIDNSNLDSQVAGNNRPLYPKVDHHWFKVAHSCHWLSRYPNIDSK